MARHHTGRLQHLGRLLHSVSFAALSLALSTGAFAASETGEPAALAPVALAPAAVTIAPPSEMPSPQPSAAPALPSEDVAVAGKLRDLIENRLKEHVTREQDRAGVRAFYEGRAYAPLWIGGNVAAPRAMAAIAYLRGVGADGLEPADYPVPALSDGSPERLAADELKLTNSVLALRAACQHRSRGVHSRQRCGLLRPESAGRRRRADQARRDRQRRLSARRLPAAAQGLQGAQGGARRCPQRQDGKRRACTKPRRPPANPRARRNRRHAAEAKPSPPRPRPPTSSSPTWSAGAGCRTTSPRPTSR